MISAPLTHDEVARSALLHTLRLLDAQPEDAFDRITRLAAMTLNTPFALISLLDGERVWFKSSVGLTVAPAPRATTLCARVIDDAQAWIIEDTANDAQFADYTLVRGEPHIRFYAGVPIFSSAGYALGALCVLDRAPRQLNAAQLQSLHDLAALVQSEIAHREAGLSAQTSSHSSHRAAEDSDARFQATFEQAAVGIAMVRLDGRLSRVNRKLCEISGYSENELLQLTFQSITHPDDLDEDIALVGRVLLGEIDNYNLEKRFVRRDGQLVWINLSVSLRRDTQGKPLYFISVVEDIQARKEAEVALHTLHLELEQRVHERTRQLQATNAMLASAVEQLRQSEDELRASKENIRTITDNLPIHIAYVDANEIFRFVNKACSDCYDLTPKDTVGRAVVDIVYPSIYQQLKPHMDKAFGGERVNFELIFEDNNDTTYWSGSYIPDIQNGDVVGLYVMVQDVTARKQLELSLESQATQDLLTGLPNRRALLAQLTCAIARANRSTIPLGVLFLDLDGFKAINDRYGHEVGDRLLQQFAMRLKSCVRETDTVARLAGDEFVIVLESLKNGMRDALALGAKIINAMSEAIELGGEQRTISASIGIHLYQPRYNITPEQLIAAADVAMYEAKRTGKNKICLAKAS